MDYVWKAGSFLNADVQKVGKKLEETREQNGGVLTPSVVVKAAKPKKSPLHDCFEWDDSKAAQQYREDQARYVLRHIAVVYDIDSTGNQKTVRAFVNIMDDENRVYQNILVAMQNVDMRQQILNRALRELGQFRERYHELEELAQVHAAIDAVAA